MQLSRRTMSKLAVGTVLAASAAPSSAFIHRGRSAEDWAKHLEDQLNAALKPDCEGSFVINRLSYEDIPFPVMTADVQLNWPPGQRRLPFTGVGDNDKAAAEEVLQKALSYFRKVWVYSDGRTCFL